MVVLLLALALLAGTANARTAPARLSVTDTAPFTVHGTGFKPNERVNLILSAENRVTRVVVANRFGRFVRQVLVVKVGSCGQYFVSARGSRGSFAVVKVVPECAPLQPVDR